MSKHLTESISDMVTFAAVGILILVPLTLIAMCIVWFTSGNWPEWTPIALGYTPPHTSMLGFNKMLLWVYERQVAWMLVSAGLLLSWLGMTVSERVDAK